MFQRTFRTTLLLTGFVVPAITAWGLSDSYLIPIRNSFEARRNSMLALQASNPYPPVDINDVQMYSWNRADFALASLYLNQNLAAANSAIIEACNRWLLDPNNLFIDGGFHWSGPLFLRIYEFFNAQSKFPAFRGGLTPEAEAAICKVMWAWAKQESRIADTETEVSKTWYIWGSENHDAMHDSTAWGAAKILEDVAPYSSYTYDDGYTAAEHCAAWNVFLKEYLRERGKKGLLVEIASTGYSKYTLQNFYNYFDFADDAVLSALAKNLLDLWWADCAEEMIDGVWGGSKARCYPGSDSETAMGDATYSGMIWYYLNIGYPKNQHPSFMCLVTSAYRLPLVVMDIALDMSGRGIYECKSRRMGLDRMNPPSTPAVDDIYRLDPNFGGIYRYTYCTPDFIIGTSMIEKRPCDDWTAISSQNKWQGVIFRGNIDARILPRVRGLTDKDKTNNQHWSVQNKGTLITQKLSTSTYTTNMRVYLSTTGLTKTEENGWVFVQAPGAYAAVRPAYGGYTWYTGDPNHWLVCNNEYAPVILEVAQKISFNNSFNSFKSAVQSNPLDFNNGVLTYTGLLGSGTFSFYTDSNRVPEINGVPINLRPNFTFQSPFLNEDWNAGIVKISKDDRQLTLDFNVTVQGRLSDDFFYSQVP